MNRIAAFLMMTLFSSVSGVVVAQYVLDAREMDFHSFISFVYKQYGSPKLTDRQNKAIVENFQKKYPDTSGFMYYRSFFYMDEEFYPSPREIADVYISFYGPREHGVFSGPIEELKRAILDWEAIEVRREEIEAYRRQGLPAGYPADYSGLLLTSPEVADYQLRADKWRKTNPGRKNPAKMTTVSHSSDYLRHRANILRGAMMVRILTRG